MGVEDRNYSASDLSLTVGFGLGLRAGIQMTKTRHKDYFESYLDHQMEAKLSVGTREQIIAALCTCPTGYISCTDNDRVWTAGKFGVEISKTLSQVGN